MLREYFVIARYVGSVPTNKNYTDVILEEVANDFRGLSDDNLISFLHNAFSVIEGEEISSEEMEDEND